MSLLKPTTDEKDVSKEKPEKGKDKKDKEELILTQDLKQFLKDKVDCDEYVIMDVEGMIE